MFNVHDDFLLVSQKLKFKNSHTHKIFSSLQSPSSDISRQRTASHKDRGSRDLKASPLPPPRPDKKFLNSRRTYSDASKSMKQPSTKPPFTSPGTAFN